MICGVNTASLPVLRESEKEELIALARSGDRAARDKMVSCNLRLVLSVVQRFWGRGENPDDLFQIGCIGLIKAIDNFDNSHDVRFSTYAVPMIIGEIRRYLRDNSTLRVSRSIKDTAYKVMQIKERYSGSSLEEPRVEIIAEELGISVHSVVTAIESVVEPVSLFDAVYSDSGDPVYVLDQIGDTASDGDWIEEIAFRDAIENLSDREKRILSLRFMDGKTQTEVSADLGISQAQVSRIEKNALEKIKG